VSAAAVSERVAELAPAVRARLAQHEDELIALADEIWAQPELGLEERAASAAQRALLERHGFAVQTGVAGMETAFTAHCDVGAGGPAIGLLGEFDALPGLSQDRVPRRKPLVEHGPGHGCGHNLLGAGSLGAALVAAAVARERGIPLRVVYFACPAEEGAIGKVVMAREGLFDGLDVALCWHPDELSTPWNGSCLALDGLRFRFAGRSAHAAFDPHNGRSALDAVELMNVAVNYLREHVGPDARIHYTIRRGGEAPNVVPDEAVSDYVVRERTRADVERLRERVLDCARGAALMTGTTGQWKLTAACADLLPNEAVEDVLLDALRAVGPPAFDERDRAFARAIRATLPEAQVAGGLRLRGVPEDLHDAVLHERVDAPYRPAGVWHLSTDVGDVSWNTPTSQLWIATMPIGTPAHSWQLTAASGAPIGHKGMLTAAGALALAAVELARSPERLDAAAAELRRRTAGQPYVSPLPPEGIPSGHLAPLDEDDGAGWEAL